MFRYPSARIMLFSKAPVAGQVKTRLIPHIGSLCAQELYQEMLRHQLTILTQSQFCPVQLWCSPSTEHPFLQSCATDYSVQLKEQWGSDLGERMANAFKQELSTHHPVIIVGSDCLSITEQDFRDAFAALQAGAPVVIQPAEDGGYVLLGLQQYIPELFTGITWGVDTVYRQTIQTLVKNKLEYKYLPLRWDVDTIEDVRRLSRQRLQMGINGSLATLLTNLDTMLSTASTP